MSLVDTSSNTPLSPPTHPTHLIQSSPVPDHYADYTPDHKLIYKFIKTLFSAAQLTAECAIITLVSSPYFLSVSKALLFFICLLDLLRAAITLQ